MINQITIRNLVGQIVKIVAVNNSESIVDISKVSAGNYIVTIKLADGRFITQKIVKL